MKRQMALRDVKAVGRALGCVMVVRAYVGGNMPDWLLKRLDAAIAELEALLKKENA